MPPVPVFRVTVLSSLLEPLVARSTAMVLVAAVIVLVPATKMGPLWPTFPLAVTLRLPKLPCKVVAPPEVVRRPVTLALLLTAAPPVLVSEAAPPTAPVLPAVPPALMLRLPTLALLLALPLAVMLLRPVVASALLTAAPLAVRLAAVALPLTVSPLAAVSASFRLTAPMPPVPVFRVTVFSSLLVPLVARSTAMVLVAAVIVVVPDT